MPFTNTEKSTMQKDAKIRHEKQIYIYPYLCKRCKNGLQNPFSIFHCVSVFFRKEKTKTGKNFGNRSASVSVSTLAFCFGLCKYLSICVSDFHRSLSVSVKEKKKIMVWESQGSRGRAEQG